MNTIAKAFVQADEPVIPALHPDAARPTLMPALDEIAAALSGVPPSFLRPTTAAALLRKAADVMQERAREYDKADGERSVAAVVTALNAIVGRDALSEAEGYLFMQLLKNVRLFSAKRFHEDSAVDGISYTALMGEARARAGL